MRMLIASTSAERPDGSIIDLEPKWQWMLVYRNSNTAVASCFAITVRMSIRQSYEYRLGAL